jgi:hypothetical protein
VTHGEAVLHMVRQKLDDLAFLRLTAPLDPASQKTYERLCEQERKLMESGLASES